MNVTVSPDPGDGVSVTFQVDGLTISDSEPTSSGTAAFSIATVAAVNNSLWDATLQIGSNTPVEAEVQVVESNGSQTIGVTLTDSEVTYCSPTSTGGSGSVTEVTGVTPILVADGTTTPEVSLDDAGITTAKIADDAVTSPKIADDAVTHGKIADLAVEHGKIGLAAVQTTNIQDNAVTDDKLADTAVTPGSYTTADITVDAQGRITSASTGSPPAGTVTSVTAGSGLTGGTITSSGTIAHGPGTFVGSEEYPVKIVVDSFGHIQVNESESTAGAYRTAVGADDADNLTSGTVAVSRGGTGSGTSPMIGVVTAADAAAARTVLDLGTASTEDVGTSGQNIVQLDNAARLPAVDGSQLTNLPSSGGGTDYTMAPITQTWRYFDDALSASTDRVPVGLNQFWIMSGGSGITPLGIPTSGARGTVRLDLAANYRRHTYWCANILDGPSEADGDELIIEARLQLVANSGSQGMVCVGITDKTNGPSYNASPPTLYYNVSDFAAITVDLNQTNVSYGIKDNGIASNPTVTDLGGSYPVSSYLSTWFRLGIHAKYNTADSDWDMTYYLNGSNVGTASMTFTSALVPYVGASVGVPSGGSPSAFIDWISYQGNIGSQISGRTTRIDIGDI